MAAPGNGGLKVRLNKSSFDQTSLINRPLTNRPLTKRPLTKRPYTVAGPNRRDLIVAYRRGLPSQPPIPDRKFVDEYLTFQPLLRNRNRKFKICSVLMLR